MSENRNPSCRNERGATHTGKVECAYLRRVLAVSILLAGYYTEPAGAGASEASEETIAIFKGAIEAVRAISHPRTGRGSAISEVSSPVINAADGSSAKSVVDFKFKDNQTHSIIQNTQGYEEEQPRWWISGKKASLIYMPVRKNISVMRSLPKVFPRKLGLDFNPQTFMHFSGDPVDVELEYLLKGRGTLSASMDDDGILHLASEYKDERRHQLIRLDLDPSKGYRLVGAKDIMEELVGPKRSFTVFLRNEWERAGSSWYVKSSESSTFAGAHWSADKSSSVKAKLLDRAVTTVTEFHPDVDIDDVEFTLAGIDLPIGTRVSDDIAGVRYQYGSVPFDTELLKEAVLSAEFPKAIAARAESTDVNAVAHPVRAQTVSEPKEVVPDSNDGEEGVVATAAQGSVLVVFVLLSLGIAAIIIVITRLSKGKTR